MKPTFVLQVDTADRPVGLVEKLEAHKQGILHRAFSIFIFRNKGGEKQLLLQQRAKSKYHSGGLWTNTCCSHAEVDTPIEETAQKRLKEEMGFSCPLQHVGTFLYKAKVSPDMFEHEIDHVFVGYHDPEHIHMSPDEADACEWVSVKKVDQWLKESPEDFTAWFSEAYNITKTMDGK